MLSAKGKALKLFATLPQQLLEDYVKKEWLSAESSEPSINWRDNRGVIQGGLGAGVGQGAANIGTSALLGALAGPAAGRTGLRALAGNPLTQQIVGQVASQGAVGLLGNRSQTIPAQTIT